MGSFTVIDTFKKIHPEEPCNNGVGTKSYYIEKEFPELIQPLIAEIYCAKNFFLDLEPIEGGLEAIKNYWPDSAYWAAGYDIDPLNRDEVYYNMGFQVDIAVSGAGNLYITGVIAIGDPDGWYPNEGQMATWNLYTKDGGETWNADPLYDNIWLQGDIGAIVQYNRPYISTTYDGHYMFFSWLDSEIDVATQNDRPNVYVIGYDVEDNTYSEVFNVTYFTQAWNQAFYGSQSYYVFGGFEPMDDMYTFEIPFVYTEFTVPGDDEVLRIRI